MKLFYKPGACSQATHIVLRELGLPHALEAVDTQSQQTTTGLHYSTINPKGYVPALQLTSGEVLTEGPAILQYLADNDPQSRLAPPSGSIERALFNGLLNYLSSELHKAFAPFFSGKTLEGPERVAAASAVLRRVQYLESLLTDGRPYLTGTQFTVADAFAFVLLSWSTPVGLTLESCPRVQSFVAFVAQRTSVVEARQTEGLLAEVA